MKGVLKVSKESASENYPLLSLVAQFTRNGMKQKFPCVVIGSNSSSHFEELIILHWELYFSKALLFYAGSQNAIISGSRELVWNIALFSFHWLWNRSSPFILCLEVKWRTILENGDWEFCRASTHHNPGEEISVENMWEMIHANAVSWNGSVNQETRTQRWPLGSIY
jgi:hypothetical protein